MRRRPRSPTRHPAAGLVDAEREAKRLNGKLRAIDKRLKGSVLLRHLDGSSFLFHGAFVVWWKGFAIVLSEHHRPAVYHEEDLSEVSPLVDAHEYVTASIARDLRAARQAAGLSQPELARKLGKSLSVIAGTESGRIKVSERHIAAVLRACGLPKDWGVPPAWAKRLVARRTDERARR